MSHPHDAHSDLIDLAPFIKRKKIAECDHPTASVDDDVASLTCDTCGHEIDPWWWMRKLAREPELFEKQFQDQERRIREQNQVIIDLTTRANETITRLNEEISHLYDVKNRLGNEEVSGQHLGTAARQMRRRKKT